MKRSCIGETEERHSCPPRASASSLHAHIMAMAGPSSGVAVPATSRKHGLSRFSLRRLFGTNPLSRKSLHQAKPIPKEVDSHSESSFVSHTVGPENKSSTSFKEAFRLTAIGHSSSDSESNSLSLGHSDSRHDSSLSGHHGPTTGVMECPLCLLELPPQCFPELSSCHHHSCYECLQQYLRIEISESRVNISCPECSELIHPNAIRMILNDELMVIKYESFMLRRVLVTEPDARWCPAPDCGYVVIASGCASCPKLKCERPGCDTYFCYHCKQEWHPNQTCDTARAQRASHSPNLRSASVSFSHDSTVQRGDIKSCPCCKVLIIKMDDGSCNHMTCSVCGTEFCWLCMKEISDLHYLSPSGCTFWGKKPWSRKKKILWQLGMLVGAPVGIALIAGIAVPAIIIGIPVWVGRKLFDKYNQHAGNKHKRNLAVTGGVMASVLVSPVLAGIAVGIGVPILLAYVYGVVPISLCRSGGCGVTTSPSGVRFDFDEENDIGIGSNLAADGVSVDTDASNRGVDPSIGEVSCGMSTSLSMGSGSHLERVGLIRDRDSDRESASNTAIAGLCLTGSITSSSLAGNTAHKVEIQADVASTKRFSLSSHSETASATVSLSERSANMSLADDASTRALAGSLLGYRDATSSAITPVEVHVDAHSGLEDGLLAGVQNRSSYEAPQGENTSLKVEDAADKSEENTISCCSDDGSHLTHTSRIKWRRASSRWQPGNIVVGDSIPETHNDMNSSKIANGNDALTPTEMPEFKDLSAYCVTFIDESLSIEGNEESTAVRFSDEVETVSDILDTPVFQQTPFPSKNLSSNFVNSQCWECHPESSPHENSRRATMHESKSLDHLASYCDFCKKVHRPCCFNAYTHHMLSSVRVPSSTESTGRSLQTTELDSVALASETSSLVNKQIAECTSAKNGIVELPFIVKPMVVVHRQHKYTVPRSAHSCTTVFECEKFQDHEVSVSRWTPISTLPHVEEPELYISSHTRTRPRSAPYFLYLENEEISIDPLTANEQ